MAGKCNDACNIQVGFFNHWSMLFIVYYLQPLNEDRFVIPKSRYASIDSYLSTGTGEAYNDVNLVMDQDIYKKLKENG